MDNQSGLLEGKEAIREYLKGVGNRKLKKFIEAGLPVRIEGGRWYAHKVNVEKFLLDYTNGPVNGVQE